ncbi:MAG: hypothetical protein J0H82_05150 [Alphaproteobacteria bacterium]|jgi:hypothetical protein|nr:hypothetical protein [Alphaproteobacteria bacterium]
MRNFWLAGLGLAAVGLVACASPGPVDNPIARNLTWFSYLNGDDIRNTCPAGVRDRYRFVYNGTFNSQVRTYDLVQDTGGGGATVTIHVGGRADLTQWFLLPDPFSPWAGENRERHVDAATFQRLVAALDQSGFQAPAPDGAFLRSGDYYWVAVGCRAGQVKFQAWTNDGDTLSRLAFVEPLLALDDTGVRFAQPRPNPEAAFSSGGSSTGQHFQLQVSGNGIGGV